MHFLAVSGGPRKKKRSEIAATSSRDYFRQRAFGIRYLQRIQRHTARLRTPTLEGACAWRTITVEKRRLFLFSSKIDGGNTMARVSSRMAAHVRIYTRLHTLRSAVCFSRQPLFIIGKQIMENTCSLFRRSEIFLRINFIQLIQERYFFFFFLTVLLLSDYYEFFIGASF